MATSTQADTEGKAEVSVARCLRCKKELDSKPSSYNLCTGCLGEAVVRLWIADGHGAGLLEMVPWRPEYAKQEEIHEEKSNENKT